MKENREFDMLENADDRTVELLSEIPVLTKEEKERMLAMSKKKVEKMNRESNIKINNDDYQVSGVERYHRPKWHAFASAAACMLLISGIGGTFWALNRNRASVFPSVQPESVSTSAATASMEEELHEIADDLLKTYDKIEKLPFDYADLIQLDETDTKTVESDYGMPSTYSRVSGGLDSEEKIREYLGETLTGDLLVHYDATFFKYLGSEPTFKEIDGALYFKMVRYKGIDALRTGFTVENFDGSSFDIYTNNVLTDGEATGVFHVVSEDGKWKLSSFAYLENEPVTELAAETAAETSSSSEDTDWAVAAAIAQKTLGGFEYRDGILSGCADIKTDPDDMLSFPTSGGGTAVYYRVTETFESVEDVREFIDGCIAGPELSSYFSFLYEDSNDYLPMFKDVDGKLYYRDYVRGQRYHFTGEPTVISANDETIEVLIDNEVPGGIEKLKATIVIDDDTYNVGYIGYADGENQQ